MWNVVKNEWCKIRTCFLASILGGLAYSITMVYLSKNGYIYSYNIEIWDQSCDLLGLIFPIAAIAPATWLLYYERKDNFLFYMVNRYPKNRYLLIKWAMTSLCGAFLVFLISFAGLVYSLFFIPEVIPQIGNNGLQNFAGWYFVNEPLYYGIILCLWRGLLGFLISSFGFVISLASDNLFVIITGPFVYNMMENFIFASLRFERFRLITSFSPTSLAPAAISKVGMIVGPCILVLMTIVLLMVHCFIKRTVAVEI